VSQRGRKSLRFALLANGKKGWSNPGDLDPAEIGFFGPVLTTYRSFIPYPVWTSLNHQTVSFSSGGCSGTSTGKFLRRTALMFVLTCRKIPAATP